MFKLIKIEGSGTNQPEPVRLPTYSDIPYKAGYAYKLSDCALMPMSIDSKPTHIAIESQEAGEKDSILCYRIQDNMIFEIPSCTDNSDFYIGEKYDLEITGFGGGKGIKHSTQYKCLSVEKDALNVKIGDPIRIRVCT